MPAADFLMNALILLVVVLGLLANLGKLRRRPPLEATLTKHEAELAALREKIEAPDPYAERLAVLEEKIETLDRDLRDQGSRSSDKLATGLSRVHQRLDHVDQNVAKMSGEMGMLVPMVRQIEARMNALGDRGRVKQ